MVVRKPNVIPSFALIDINLGSRLILYILNPVFVDIKQLVLFLIQFYITFESSALK